MRVLGVIAVILGLPLCGGFVPAVRAQSAPAASSDEIDATVARALDLTSDKLIAKVRNMGLTMHWIGRSDRFWYRKSLGPSEVEFRVVDARTGHQSPLFDGKAIAAVLAAAGSRESEAAAIRALDVNDDGRSFIVTMRRNDAPCRWPRGTTCNVEESSYRCDLPVSVCTLLPELSDAEVMSPDHRTIAFVRNHNVWVRAVDNGAEKQLTQDAVPGFSYGVLLEQFGTNEIARRRNGLPKPVKGVAWSPDGKYLLLLRHDLRAVPPRLAATEYVPPEEGAPIVHMVRQALTTDIRFPEAFLEVIDVTTGTVHRCDVDPQMLTYANLGYVWWTHDNKKVWLVEVDRTNREERLVGIDVPSGHSKVSFAETAQHELKRAAAALSSGDENAANIAVLSSGREALWYSERDGWGHLYLYDTITGVVKRQLTRGEWLVVDVLRVDEKARTVFFTAVGREPGRDPYYRLLYRASLDGGVPVLLTPENADHDFESTRPGLGLPPGGSISPTGRYILDTFSTIDQPDKTVLRSIGGKPIGLISEADISELKSLNWRAPERFVVKAADRTTDLYGALYKPRNFDPSKKYPVIEITYPSGITRFAPKMFREDFSGQAFVGSTTLNAVAFAEAGAIVVAVDGRGSGYRSRDFRTAFDSNCDDQRGVVDHVAAIRNLASTRPYMDLSRVGVTGHSTGGYAALRSILLFPDFFKVSVAGEIVSDFLTISGAPSAEVRYGVPSTPEILDCYRRASNESLAQRLQGKLLIIAGGADEEARLQQSMRMFAALQAADKSYDTLIMPDAPHVGGRLPYGVRQTVKYFVQHLGGPR